MIGLFNKGWFIMMLFTSSFSRTSYGTKALPKPVLARVDFGDTTRGEVFDTLSSAAKIFEQEGIGLTPSKVSEKNARVVVGKDLEDPKKPKKIIVANGTTRQNQIFSLYHTDTESPPQISLPSGVLQIPVNVNDDFGIDAIREAFKNVGFLG